jgi:hypothetical protein
MINRLVDGSDFLVVIKPPFRKSRLPLAAENVMCMRMSQLSSW